MRKISVLAAIWLIVSGLSVTVTPALAQDDFDLFDDIDEPEVKTKTAPKAKVAQPEVKKKEPVVPAKKEVKVIANEQTTKEEPIEPKEKVNVTQEEKSPKTEVNEALPPEKTEAESEKGIFDNFFSDDDDRETWLESLINSGTSELFKKQSAKEVAAEKARIAKVLRNKRSNAANFDIAGIKLRMKPSEVEDILTKQGFRRLTQDFSIPNFIKWRGEELCRIHGIVGFERLKACAREIAVVNGFEYVSLERYNRQATRETLEIHYTSTFSDNLSHYIIYTSNVPISTSKASQNVYINNLKIYDFWRRIDMRYGQPDNASEVKWGLGGKKPYLQASTGKLELVDPLLRDLDISRMLNEDSRLSNVPYYSF